MFSKLILAGILVVGYGAGSYWFLETNQDAKTEQALKQLEDDSGKARTQVAQQHIAINNAYAAGWMLVGVLVFSIFWSDAKKGYAKMMTAFDKFCQLGIALLLLLSAGCYRPFEPVKLEVIASHEEAFLLPYTGDSKKQTSSNNEEFLKNNLVYTKQVRIPQQWVQSGYETMGPNGSWQDAAVLVKVDTAPVTREWTADPTSGTSNRNEAIWVMTSDQVEFSTGWTCTARIASRDDAVKFLHNYPNGTLEKVLDHEVRAKLQADFGLEVTDLPMEELRKAATPHLVKVTKKVIDFFKERGISITNLGITGGFVYKDRTIQDTMVKVFNSEQERAIAAAGTSAQQERNKKVILEATGKADALLKQKEAEAKGIKLVADAKFYEIEKAKGDMASYRQLKELELQKELLMKWDGSYPRYFMGGAGSHPNLLMQLPSVEQGVKK